MYRSTDVRRTMMFGSIRHVMFLISCCLMLAVSVGICINAYGVFITPVSEALGVGRGSVSLHVTLSALATGLLSPLAIKLLKWVRLKMLCTVGLIITALSTWLMAYAQSVIVFDILGLVRGISLALFSMAVLTTAINQWFIKDRSTVTGMAMAFAGIAGAVFSPVLTALIERFGYADTFKITAVLMLVPALPAILCFVTDRPQDVGLLPYGEGADHKAAEQPQMALPLSYRSSIFITLGVLAFALLMVTSLTQHLSGYAQSVGLSLSTGALMLSCVMIGNIGSKLFLGYFGEKVGAFTSSIVMMGVCLLGLIMLLCFPTSTILLYAGSLFFGFAYSVSAVGLSNIVYYLYGNEQYGRAYSIVSMLTCVGSALSLTFFGLLYDFTGSYRATLILCTCLMVASIGLALLVSHLAHKKKG